MKLGLFSAAFPQWSLEQFLAWSAENGFEMVEIACWPPGKAERRYAGVTHIDVTNLTPTGAKEIQAMLKHYGLQISSLGYYPNPLHPDPDHRQTVIEHLKKVILAAEMLEVPIVGTFIGKDKNKTVPQNLEEYAKVWPPIVKFAREHGIKIAIENCPMIFTYDEWPGGNNLASTPAIWRKMWEIIPDENFGLNLDPSHLILQMIDYVRVVHEFKDRIFHVHAKDLMIDREGLYNHGVLSQGMGWQVPRLPGFGEVDWGKFIGALYRVGYDYVLSIEHEDRAFEGTEDLVKRGFLIARDVLRPYVH
ncbi:sugar phosphate isomerase/epimerase [Thermanaerothrix sp. 4228-RoL]|jgi:sugar phosphate isomerase/epimerase|uniref:Sugar phosphate isomerase/epimerase n=1 Tax=Thermanaerothrix solaris TaxID=3058434 RepID=A0ABU3NK10_9CHLR|nr:sugar phosphate isomerase/epimerase [Thermanaerothrix sp. 4228-RoL]MDT8897185.1 sugar phosphate isomerase/epimerase [Thermanaerothrix sp. 4228-RoL]